MWKEIGQAFHKLGATGEGCRCIILTGKGKGFCGGIDITDETFFSGIQNDENVDFARKTLAFKSQIVEMQAAFTAVEQCTVPVVAAIHGACVGAGVDLVCCADVRVCSPNSKFSVREVRLGLAADVGTLQRLPKLVGHSSRIRELCLTGEDFTADEAFRIGFVSRVSKSDKSLFDTANEVVSRIVRHSPVAVAVTKSSLNYSRDHSVAEGLEHIALQNSAALMTEDLAKSFMASSGSLESADFDPLLQHSCL
jgi:enoyl-CoA hydratase/carnithine racemase